MPEVIWITGLPGSGKSTIADELLKRHPQWILLRMDELRKVATPEPTYSETERDILYRSLVFTATILYRAGHTVIIDATGNLRKWRQLAREMIPRFYEVYLKCSLSECERREEQRRLRRLAPKDIYKKAKEGWPVPGVVVPYESPECPELTIDTEKTSPQEAADLIEQTLST